MRKGITFLILVTLAGQSYAQTFDWRRFIFWDKGRNFGLVRPGLVGAWDLRTVNLLKYSEDFSNAAWINIGPSVTVSSAGVTPLGTSASKITEAAVSYPGIYQIAAAQTGGYYSISFLFKPGTEDRTLIFGDIAGGSVGVSLYGATGGIVLCTGQCSSETIGDGWVKVSVTGVLANHGIGFYTNGVGNTSKYYYISAFQVNEGSTALPYVATTDLQTVPNLVPGGASLTLGASTAAGSDDPVRRASGMVFDGSNDFLVGAGISAGPNLTMTAVSKVSTSKAYGMLMTGQECSTDLLHNDTKLRLSYNGTNTNIEELVTYLDLPWMDFTATANASGAALYRDAIQVKSGATASDSRSNITTLMVGNRGTAGGSLHFAGTISYVLLYSRALTPREIRSNHQWLKAKMAEVGVSLP